MSTRHHSNKTLSKPHIKSLHSRNLHKNGYDFPFLVKGYPLLAQYVKTNAHGNLSIDFAIPDAVKALNAALLRQYYNIIDWDIPEGALCPPIPGRVDYIHYVAELLEVGSPTPNLNIPQSQITLLDIGTGANGIYPLLACQIYGWCCVGSDINTRSLENIASIIANNPKLTGCFKLRRQHDKNHFFEGIIKPGDFFDVSVCNPPFHKSREEAIKGSTRKLNNLARNRGEETPTHANKNDCYDKATISSPTLNFGGLEAELWCKGGERLFLKKLIKESFIFSTQCRWFTSLISKNNNVKPLKNLASKLGATDIREFEMVQGNKVTRILAWTFL